MGDLVYFRDSADLCLSNDSAILFYDWDGLTEVCLRTWDWASYIATHDTLLELEQTALANLKEYWINTGEFRLHAHCWSCGRYQLKDVMVEYSSLPTYWCVPCSKELP